MRTNTQYLIDETRWLLSFGRPVTEIAAQLHRSPISLYQMGRRHDLPDIKAAFAAHSHDGVKA